MEVDNSERNLGETAEREEPPHAKAVSDLPDPELVEEYSDLSPYPPGWPVGKGLAGAFVRVLKGIPPCIWVINQHDDDITVVVSKYRPNRLASGAEVNLSATGGGIGISSTTYMGPATTKVLAPEETNKRASVAVFPLWTRSDGFGVISIFKGSEKLLYIENDRVPAGSTAYFRNTPDLTIVSYEQAVTEKLHS